MSNLKELINKLPKAELHLHIEGSLEPEMMMKLAERNNVKLPYSSIEEIKEAYNFSQLQDFLDIYYAGMSVLIHEIDFYELTMAYLINCNVQNIKHVEIFFDPQGHTHRGVDFATAISGINKALCEGKEKFGISFKVIMCFLRHLSQEDAFTTLIEAADYIHLIDGVGLDSSEINNPPSKFEDVFRKAKDMGLKLVAHAGEEGPPSYVEEALSVLKIDRLDHGNRAMESQDLIKKLVKNNIALTVCPLSNLKLCVVDSLSQHPVLEMLEQGLLVTINSDDPSYFGGYINENFNALIEHLDLKHNHIVTLIKNSFIGSFLSESEANKFIDEIDKIVMGLGFQN